MEAYAIFILTELTNRIVVKESEIMAPSEVEGRF
jgi:hypothetical protein